MLIIFKSGASADVVMVEKNGKEMLAILGKPPDDSRGVVSVEQLPEAIMTLKTLIDERRSIRQEWAKTADDHGDGEVDPGDDIDVSLRSLPLLELLERSLQEKLPVTWGV